MFRPPKGNLTKKINYKHQAETCAYKLHTCTQTKLDNYDYCLRHILEDKTAPFRQCGFIHSATGRRCINPTPKTDRRESSYCSEHIRKAQLRHQRQSSRIQPPRTAESLLSSISHFVKPIKTFNNQSQRGSDLDPVDKNNDGQELISTDTSEKEQVLVTKSLNPFVDIDATSINNSLNHVLDYCSESDSDVDITTVDDTFRIKDEDSSEAESIDSSNEDIFKHAGVFTPEEIVLRTKEKLVRLQTLYIDQFKRLQHILKERRRDYLVQLQKEKETMCSIANQPRETIREQRLYKKLKSLKHHHKRYGVEVILQKKAHERRTLVTEGVPQKASSASKCIFTEGGVKCSLKTLPCAKYCNKHILEDPNQMLFRRCGVNRSDSICQEPVLHIYNSDNCVFHYNIPSVHLSYNTSISSDEEEDKELTKRNMKQLQRNDSNKKFKLEEPKVKQTIKGDVQLKTETPSDSKLYENLKKSALYRISDKDGSKMKLDTDMITEKLPLQIMESKEVNQEEAVKSEESVKLQNVEGSKDGSTDVESTEVLYITQDEFVNHETVTTEECIVTESSDIEVCDV